MRAPWLAGLLLWTAFSAQAQEGLTKDRIRVSSYLDWAQGQFVLDLTAPLVKDSNVLPVNRFRTETFLAENLKEMMISALFSLRLDSSQVLQDLVIRDATLFTSLGNLVAEMTQTYSRTDPGYENLTIRYSLPIFSRLMGLLVSHTAAEGDFMPLGYRPTKDFTGLVIYIPPDLENGKLVPALFPKIWDRNQDLVLETRNLDPAYLRKWGTMNYSEGFSEEAHRERIGNDPLRVVAVGIQGQTTTDIVLSVSDADKIRFSPFTRQRVSQGRILVIQGR